MARIRSPGWTTLSDRYSFVSHRIAETHAIIRLTMERKKPDAFWGIMLVVATVVVAFALLGRRAPHSVVRITHADPKLAAAVKEAQTRLPEFLTALSQPKPGDRYAIKGAFKTDSGPEYLWVRDPSYKEGVFKGTLDQTPIAARTLKKGDEVSVAKKDVYDWLMMRNGAIRGEFTEKALSP